MRSWADGGRKGGSISTTHAPIVTGLEVLYDCLFFFFLPGLLPVAIQGLGPEVISLNPSVIIFKLDMCKMKAGGCWPR